MRKHNRRTEVSMKCKIVRAVLKKGVSCEQIALEYGVGHSSLCKWVHIVQNSGYRGLKKREPNKIKEKDMARPGKKAPESELEKLRAENELLRTENALLKKVKALVEEKEAHANVLGHKPSKN